MNASPLVVVADAKVLGDDGRGLGVFGMFDGNRQGLRSVSGSYHTAVAIALLLIGVLLFYQDVLVTMKLLVPLHRSEVCCLKKCGAHWMGLAGEGWCLLKKSW